MDGFVNEVFLIVLACNGVFLGFFEAREIYACVAVDAIL